MAGYTRNDTPNNIADGNVINASDLDGEFDAIQTAFGTDGHTHDGTAGNGPQIATGGLADNAVTTAKITDANVTTDKIADSNVTTAKIADANVTLAKMAANSIDSDQYVDGSIDTDHIGNLQVTTAKIAADAIDGTKIADDVIDSEHYVAGSIDAEHLASDSVTTAKILNANVTTDKIADANVTLAKIANQAANTVLVRDANSSGVVSAKAVADTQILIGDGTGFTAAALSGDVTMANTGAVTIANDAVETAMIANDAVTLGTKTSGNYVATGAVSGVGLSGSASAEGATFTVSSNATDANTASTIVARDGSGNFSAGTITASLTGNIANTSTLELSAGGIPGIIALSNSSAGGVTYGNIKVYPGLEINSPVNNANITFTGNDGGTTITALTLDMSEKGTAIFNDEIQGVTRYSTSLDGINPATDFAYNISMQMYFDGNDNYIEALGRGSLGSTEDVGHLYIQNNNNDHDVIIRSDDGSGGLATYFQADGSSGEAQLFHYGSEKLNTTSTGIDVTGNVVVSGTVDGRDVASDGSKLDGIASGAQTGTVTSVATGTGLTGGTITGSGTITHADTSTQASVSNSGSTFIQSVTLDDFGHVTALTSAAAGGSAPTIQVFTSSGTWNRPSGCKGIKVTVQGGGGGGGRPDNFAGNNAGSGAGGGFGVKFIDVGAISSVTVTVGAAGSTGGLSSNGGTGGTSSFGAYVSATGGGGGLYNSSTRATGGSPSGHDWGVQGGTAHNAVQTGYGDSENHAGFSLLGTPGKQIQPANSSALSGTGYGAGGGAGTYNGGGATAGGPGIVIVEEFY